MFLLNIVNILLVLLLALRDLVFYSVDFLGPLIDSFVILVDLHSHAA